MHTDKWDLWHISSRTVWSYNGTVSDRLKDPKNIFEILNPETDNNDVLKEKSPENASYVKTESVCDKANNLNDLVKEKSFFSQEVWNKMEENEENIPTSN